MQDGRVVKNPVYGQAWQLHYLYRKGGVETQAEDGAPERTRILQLTAT
jgi:hypothetical protein